MNKMVLIVEGRRDADAVHRVFPDVKMIVTEGTRVDNKTKSAINKCLEQNHTIFILADPDEAGKRLVEMLHTYVNANLPVIAANPDDCRCYCGGKWKTGIEYCSNEYLYELLMPYLFEEGKVTNNEKSA